LVKEVICSECNKEYNVNNYLYDKKDNLTKSNIYSKWGVFTTIVRIKGSNCNVVPVKSSRPLNKNLWVECSKVLSRIHVGAPIKRGDIVCKNILNTGVNIICTKSVDKRK
jgi:CxxC motif-containing protein